MKQLWNRLLTEEKGQGITEYALILGLVVFGIWILVTQSGIAAAINGLFQSVASEVTQCADGSCGNGT